ncbi:MAG: CPBP family intramembrane glutamic endopeptidase [Candidatus Bathyarchaeia archaeon]
MKDISLFLILYSISMAFFIVQTYGSVNLFSVTIAFAVMGAISLLAALYTKSEEGYYENINAEKTALTILCLVGMVMVSSIAVWFIEKVGEIKFASILYYPTVFSTLLSTVGASSVFSCLLGEMVYQISAVAAGEELLKFVAYSEIKRRYGDFIAVVIPVGFWAGFHALQAYSNVLYVIPAFVCGLLLLWLLEKTKSIMAPIIAHGAYNTLCAIPSAVSSPNPIFPLEFTSGDIMLIGLAAMWIAWIIIPAFRSNV